MVAGTRCCLRALVSPADADGDADAAAAALAVLRSRASFTVVNVADAAAALLLHANSDCTGAGRWCYIYCRYQVRVIITTCTFY